MRPLHSGPSNHPGHGLARAIRNHQEIEAHALAKFAQLVFDRRLRRRFLRRGEQQLHARFQRSVFARDPQEPAVLQIASRPQPRDRNLVFAQRGLQPFPHRRLHQALNGPEASAQQQGERHEVEKKDPRAEAHSICAPVPCPLPRSGPEMPASSSVLARPESACERIRPPCAMQPRCIHPAAHP